MDQNKKFQALFHYKQKAFVITENPVLPPGFLFISPYNFYIHLSVKYSTIAIPNVPISHSHLLLQAQHQQSRRL